MSTERHETHTGVAASDRGPGGGCGTSVKQVVLYKHGVGSSSARKAGPGESARLDFNASEMNDVLKSLTIEERGGGKIPACATTPWIR